MFRMMPDQNIEEDANRRERHAGPIDEKSEQISIVKQTISSFATFFIPNFARAIHDFSK